MAGENPLVSALLAIKEGEMRKSREQVELALSVLGNRLFPKHERDALAVTADATLNFPTDALNLAGAGLRFPLELAHNFGQRLSPTPRPLPPAGSVPPLVPRLRVRADEARDRLGLRSIPFDLLAPGPGAAPIRRLFHGTNAGDISKLSKEFAGSSTGLPDAKRAIWVTDNPRFADLFRNPTVESSRVLEISASPKNPLVVDASNIKISESARRFSEIIDDAADAGHDAVEFRNFGMMGDTGSLIALLNDADNEVINRFRRIGDIDP